MKRLISLLLCFPFFIQSCVVYQKVSVSLEESQDAGRVKIVYITGEESKFKNIIWEDSTYYGIRKKTENASGQHQRIDVKTTLVKDEVQSVYLKNKTMSTLATISLVPIAFGVYGIIALLYIDLHGL